jgi:trimeric autotransporter adhesin
MSTKTTFKRIALVAVAALGLGVLTSVAPASANTVPTVGASSGFSLNTTSITMVDDGNTTDVTPGNDVFAAFEVSVSNANGYANTLRATESLTATVIGNPGNGVVTANANIALSWASTWAPQDGSATAAGYSSTTPSVSIGSADSAYAKDLNLAASKRGGTATSTDYTLKAQEDSTTTALLDGGAATATYALMVAPRAAAALDAGFYTIRIDLLDANKNAIKSTTIKYQVATSKVNSGAVVTTTVTGSQLKGAVVAATDVNSITATLADANGGLVRTGANAAPSLSGTITDSTATTPIVDALTLTDAGTNEDADSAILDGAYVATSTSAAVIAGLAGAATVKIVFGAASSSAALVIRVVASEYAYTAVTAAGKVANATTATNFDVPLTTKSVSVSAVAVATDSLTGTPSTGKTLYYTLSYASCVTADVTTKVSTPTKITTDASGVATVTIAHANPASGCAATVTFTGATVVTGAILARTITWKAPVATNVVADSGSYKALVGSSHKVTWTVLDQFNNPVVGKTATFTISGANKPTAGLPSQVTDAKGQLSFAWTDAKGVAASTTLGSDTVAVATVGADTPTSLGSVTVTYVAALPVTASINATYGATSAGATIVAPATAIGGSAGKRISANDQIDQTDIVTAADPGAVFVRFAPLTSAEAAVSGVPMVVTVTGGAKLLDSVGYLATTRTVYGATTFTIVGLKTGVSTVTAVQGAVTKSVTINFVNADTDARVIAVKESAGTVTATVTDAFGNAVAGVTVGASLSGAGRLGNGATSGTFVTAADGTVSFDVNGAATATVSLSSTYTKASFLANAGDTTGTVVTTGAPAGVRVASVATAGNTVVADTAQAAADAAAEATDAANAATDAANAAAEAADAATAAAQDAADAVAALSTQVSEMVSALKKQITALTNLVIKIQKKVKA